MRPGVALRGKWIAQPIPRDPARREVSRGPERARVAGRWGYGVETVHRAAAAASAWNRGAASRRGSWAEEGEGSGQWGQKVSGVSGMPRRGCGMMQRRERRGWLAALGRSRGWWHAEWAKAGLRARGEAGFALAAELGRSGTRARLRWSSGRGASWAEVGPRERRGRSGLGLLGWVALGFGFCLSFSTSNLFYF